MSSKIRSLSIAGRAILILAGGLVFGVMAVLAGAVFHADTASAASPTCATVVSTEVFTLEGGTIKIADVAGTLEMTFGATTTPCGIFTSSGGAVNAIQFVVDPTATVASTVILDQTSSIFPCDPVQGAVGSAQAGNGIVEVFGQDGESITVGANGVNLRPGVCTSAQIVALDNVASYELTDNSGALGTPVVLSAAGDSTTGNPATLPVTFVGGSATPAGNRLNNSTFKGGSANDTFTAFGDGNTFQVGTGTDAITATDTASTPNNTLDFSRVQTSPSSHLAVNVSGISQTVGTTTVKDGQAALGSIISDTFNSSAFSTIHGATNGDTDFLGGDHGGLTFTAQPSTPGNAADFTGASAGVFVNLTAGTVSANVAPLVPSSADTLNNLTDVTGSSHGNNFFLTGSGPSYSFTGNGNSNIFDGFGGTGTDTFTSNGTSNEFFPGLGPATFVDPTSGNLVDLDSGTITTAAVINVSGTTVNTTLAGSPVTMLNDTATVSGGPTYTFTALAEPTQFIGSSAGTTFFAGTGADTFTGVGGASNELSYASAPGGPLTVSLVTGHAVLGGVTETFSSISTFDSLNGGSTRFVSGGANGDTFNATGTGNTADYSLDTHAITANLAASPNTVSDTGGGSADTLTGITTVFGSDEGHNTFTAGSGSETFRDSGPPVVGPNDVVDFSNVSTSGSTPLTVNVSGSPVNGVATSTAVAGPATYTFNNNALDFTDFKGALSGNTLFLAGTTGDLTFTAQGASGNSADFSAANAGLDVDLGGPTPNVTGGGVSAPGDTLVNVTDVTGSSVGGTTFTGGSAGPYTFTGHATSNTFVAGAANDTFVDPTSGNTVDLSALSSIAAVDVSGVTANGTNNGTATAGGRTYTFTSLGEPTVFKGSLGGTTFYAGTAQDTFNGTPGSGPNELSYQFAPGSPLTVCLAVSTAPCGTANRAVLGGATEQFSNIQTFDSLAGGNTTFVSAKANNNTFKATGSGNKADYTPDLTAITADFASPTETVSDTSGGAGPDIIAGITTVIGSNGGGNVFKAGSGSETFGDTGGTGGDTADFSSVSTSPSTQLFVNVSGNTVNGALTSTAVAVPATYSFNTDFTKFLGSVHGNTVFLAGTAGGLDFTAQPATPGNSADFSAAGTGLNVNLSTNTVNGGGVSPADTLHNLTDVTGSSVGGTTFTGGLAGPYTFTGHATSNTFVAGAANDTFIDPTSGNTVDLSALTSIAAVDVSGVAANGTNNGTATAGGRTYTFTSLAEPTVFKGSLGGTTFYAGTAQDTFNGTAGSGPNELSYQFAPGGPLAVCLAVSTPACVAANQAVLGGATEPFSNIQTYDSLAGGSTTFLSAKANKNTFKATGILNTADYTPDTTPITAALGSAPQTVSDTSGGTGPDIISGITTIIGSDSGSNVFQAGSGSETFGDNGTTGGDTVDLSAVNTSQTTPLTVNLTGHPVNGTATSTAVAVPATYTFNNKAPDFTKFVGATSGFTRFDANGTTGGYTFQANGPSNTADFSTTSGVTVDLTMPSGNVTGTGSSPALNPADSLTGAFLSNGDNTVVGSSSGSNTFFGKLVGTAFTAQNPGATNTVSYENMTSFPSVNFDLNVAQISAPTAPGALTDSYSFPPSAKLTAQGSTGNDTFVVGTSAAAIQGGGGQDGLDVSFVPGSSSGPNGVTVDLNNGIVKAPSGNTVATFKPSCAFADPTFPSELCVTGVNGSTLNDKFIANSQALSGIPQVDITGKGPAPTLDLSNIGGTGATICMPISNPSPLALAAPCNASGFVAVGITQPSTGMQGITFTGIANVTGTQNGGDYVYDGNGTSTFTEHGNTATLDFSNLPLLSPPAGVTVTTSNPLGTQQGSATSPLLGISDSFFGFNNFVGTNDNDSFTQSGPGTYTFAGGLGANSLDLSAAPANATVAVLSSPAGECSSGPGFTNTDGSATVAGQLMDTFFCVSNLVAPSSSTFQASTLNALTPAQTATLNGGGTGTLELVNDLIGTGTTINLATTPKNWVTGDGYNFQFSGMSTIVGTPQNDTFIPGSTNVTLNGGGGQDGLSYLGGTVPGTSPAVTFNGAPAAVDVNLSNSSYQVPSGMPNAGATVPACTATGGFGGTITMTGCSISNVTGTSSFSDALVAGPGTGTLSGGSGSDRFVLTHGGQTSIVGGSGSSTLDLSQLSGITSFALSDPTVQLLPSSGSVQVLSGNIQTVIASPAGSNLTAGFGNATLVGGPGNDVLAAGTAGPGQTQTLIGNGGTDTLIGGVGNDVLEGGNQPVTFQPGEGTDTLTSPVAGNTLSYAAAITGVRANLSSDVVEVPAGKPFAGPMPAPHTAQGGFPGTTVDLSGASINHLVGSPFTDVFVTSGSNDNISGGGGSDLFVMENGNNIVNEPAGSSPYFLFNGAGSNIIQAGGTGTLDFSEVPSTGTREVVNLQNGTANGGFGGSQTFTGIDSVFGTNQNFKDILIAGPPGGMIVGQGTGSDLLVAGPSGGDTLIGGAGPTTFCSEHSNPCANGASTNGGATAAQENHMFGGSFDDSFFVKNLNYDSIVGQIGSNDVAQKDAKDPASNIRTFLP